MSCEISSICSLCFAISTWTYTTVCGWELFLQTPLLEWQFYVITLLKVFLCISLHYFRLTFLHCNKFTEFMPTSLWKEMLCREISKQYAQSARLLNYFVMICSDKLFYSNAVSSVNMFGSLIVFLLALEGLRLTQPLMSLFTTFQFNQNIYRSVILRICWNFA